MTRYYYLLASLLNPDEKGVIKNNDIIAVREFITRNLSRKDRVLFDYLLYPNDIHNLLIVLFNKDAVFRTPAVLEEATLRKYKDYQYDLPKFIQHFLVEYFALAETMTEHEATDLLYSFFFEEIKTVNSDFIKKYFEFDHSIRNILVALNTRKYMYSKTEYLLDGEPFYEEIRHNNDESFGLSGIFEFVPEWAALLLLNQQTKLAHSIDRAREVYIDQLLKGDAFTSAHVFGYFLKFQLYYRWKNLNEETGEEKLQSMVDTLTNEALEYTN
ncbi:MAG: DUF2764 family protein [Bacteroidota bacterium]